MKIALLILTYGVSTIAKAALPVWLENQAHPEYQITKSTCVVVSGDKLQDQTLAVALVKAAIVQSLSATVTATTTLEIKDDVEGKSLSEEQFKQSITLLSKGEISRLQKIKAGYFSDGGTSNYCAWYGYNL
ncbi:hypothetical protein P7F88_17730 [Vibrio hannami]|uniref:hypothetical protein n=1 Tax=Vibrio hannami TaxID=2717094 RepID=UPI00240FDEEC|nr:hypothetical protein [Vibrio hannami]MDG3087808.1 hypothetical protein [Vibrio hannami]